MAGRNVLAICQAGWYLLNNGGILYQQNLPNSDLVQLQRILDEIKNKGVVVKEVEFEEGVLELGFFEGERRVVVRLKKVPYSTIFKQGFLSAYEKYQHGLEDNVKAPVGL